MNDCEDSATVERMRLLAKDLGITMLDLELRLARRPELQQAV